MLVWMDGQTDLDLLNVVRPHFCTLTTHSWLNWVDEDDWGGWGKMAWKRIQKTLDTSNEYIEIRPEAPGVWAKDLIPNFAIIGKCRLGNGAGSSLPGGSGRGWNPNPGAPPTMRLLVVLRPQPRDSWFFVGSFIKDHPPGPNKSPFMTCRVRGVYYYPDPPRLLDLHPEAEHTFRGRTDRRTDILITIHVCPSFGTIINVQIYQEPVLIDWFIIITITFCNTLARLGSSVKDQCTYKENKSYPQFTVSNNHWTRQLIKYLHNRINSNKTILHINLFNYWKAVINQSCYSSIITIQCSLIIRYIKHNTML